MNDWDTKKQDREFMQVFLSPIRKCKEYQPAFGSRKKEEKSSFEAFEERYGSDPFYCWLGMDSEEVYAAHKAAGGLTSVYRQLGIGAERLFRAVLINQLSLSEEQINWGYEYSASPKNKVHTLDAKISCLDLDKLKQKQFSSWLSECMKRVSCSPNIKIDGAIFEVRQGYKSADSKRQNADLRFGINAYQKSFLPVFAVFSTQVSLPVINRYQADGMLVLTGVNSSDPTISTFAFFKHVVGYDLADFFRRNQRELADEVVSTVGVLLKK